MRCLIALASVVCVALLIGTGAFAQVPPNPDNPNDAVADALTPPPYGEPINLETAKMVAAAAAAEASKRHWNAFCIAIVNPSGDLVYFEKQDNCQYASIGVLATQGPDVDPLSPSDLGVRNADRQGPLLCLPDDPR